MKIIKYLFFKYYYFQIAVGNQDIAPFSSIMFICFILQIICADLCGLFYFFIPCFANHPLPSIFVFLLLFVIIFVFLYFLLLHHKKYKTILDTHEEEWKGKKNTSAVLFAVVPFVVLLVELFIKMQMNRGII